MIVFKGMFESPQAKLVGGFAAISVLLSLISIVRSTQKAQSGLKTATLFFSMIFFIISLGFLLLSIYDVNCTIIGGCSVWGWIKAILIVLSLLMGIAISIWFMSVSSEVTVTLATEQEKEKEKEKEKPVPTTA